LTELGLNWYRDNKIYSQGDAMDAKISQKWRWAIPSALFCFLFFCAGIFQLSLASAEEVKKEEKPGPQVISKALIPFPPRLLDHVKNVQITGKTPEVDEKSTEPEADKETEEEAEESDSGCKSYDDSMCQACNPPTQDVGESCVAYEKQADGTCVCTSCETVECGSS
jgi:hypothetical protein